MIDNYRIKIEELVKIRGESKVITDRLADEALNLKQIIASLWRELDVKEMELEYARDELL